jgi:hypothetical protein
MSARPDMNKDARTAVGLRGVARGDLRKWEKRFGVDQSRVEIQCHLPQRRRCALPRVTQALRIGIVACLPLSWATAQYAEAKSSAVEKTALEAPTTTVDSATDDMSVPLVVIEAERLDPALDNAEQRFRDALGPPPVLIASERHLTDGAAEVSTRFGRFCEKPLPGSLQSPIAPIGGSITLPARYASY